MENFTLKKVLKNEDLLIYSQKIPIKPNQKYKTSAKTIGTKGIPYSTYFMVSIQDEFEDEISKHIKWINDFDGKVKENIIIFSSPPEGKNVILGFKVNSDVPVKADIEIELPDTSSLKLQEIHDDKIQEVFDNRIKFEVPNFAPLTQEEENLLEKRITWVFGVARSGTTWFSERLLKHPDNFFWNEPRIGRHLGVSNSTFDEKTSKHKIERLYDKMAQSQHTYFFYPGHRNNWLPALRRFILARTFSEVQGFQKNVIIKEPVGSTASDIIMECLPNSKMIFLIRDGRDVVDSLMAMHGEKTWAKLEPITTKNRIEKISHYCSEWVHAISIISRAFKNHNSSLRLKLKYEDLRLKTFSQLRKTYDFLGININDEQLRTIVNTFEFDKIPLSKKGTNKFNRSALVGGWKKNFDKKEQDIMNSIIGETLKENGYKI